MTTTYVPDTTRLDPVDGFPFPVFTSRGSQAKAVALAQRARQAIDWLADALGGHHRPPFTLFVADPNDWNRVTTVPLYGMPHAFGGRGVTGAQPAGFWSELTEVVLPQLTPEGAARVRQVYGDPPDVGGRFADLIIAHELTHLFHEFDEATGETDFPRRWVAELFANIGLYGYFAAVETDELPVLETICQLTWQAPAIRRPVRELNRMADSLAAGALNYIWFEFGLLLLAKQIWEANGVMAFRFFYHTLRRPDLSDDQILQALQTIHPRVEEAVRQWPA